MKSSRHSGSVRVWNFAEVATVLAEATLCGAGCKYLTREDMLPLGCNVALEMQGCYSVDTPR